LILKKISKIGATRCQILRLKCTKIDFGWRSAPDPAGELAALPQAPYLYLRGLLLSGRRGEQPYTPLSKIPGYATARRR